ncbi:mevalonate kinase [Lentilactobacillus senioris]|uniref:mevalonate kinase n=1 Tax=Lentilactobacillus senioris TaxID=931534 RepID=UPI00227E29F3|nr:mevalonate kinase [Lentilactobacillus senioris]MCY9806843.1 mevalonate kinase [Lentilactobacillus senioris]
MKKIGFGASSAKIIWFGEHSVVYGQPAIALPLPAVKVSAQIKIRQQGTSQIFSRYYDGDWDQVPVEMAGIKQLTESLRHQLGLTDYQFQLVIDSDIPAERGMGSSAATAVAITRAFFDLSEKHLTRTDLLKAANIAEQVTHGNPSGLDAATASAKWPIWYVKNKENTKLPINLSTATMVIADSGVKGKTSVAVNQVKEQLIIDPKTQDIIDKMGAVVNQVPSALIADDVPLLGSLMNQNHNLLRQLNVSTPQLDLMQIQALDSGAFGAKLTGSGLGGCLIAIAPNLIIAQKVANDLFQVGASATWIQPLNQFEKQD